MVHFAYSFCFMLLHSLWQAGLLLLAYWTITKIPGKKVSPDQRKNLLFLLILSQVALSLITFLVYFTGQAENPGTLLNTIAEKYLPAKGIESISPWLFGLYILFFAFRLFKTSYSWYHFNRLYRSGLQKPPVELRLFTMIKAEQFAISRPVKLFLSNTVSTPVTFGFLRPVILLPVALVTQLSTAQAEALILHELTHIKANDYLKNWIVVFAENVFFFNPFILGACKMIRMEREKNCDAMVIRFQYPAAVYAQALLQAERLKQATSVMPVAAVSGKQQLLSRIRFFAQVEKKDDHAKKGFGFSLFLLFAVLLMSVYSVLHFSGKDRQPAITNTAPSSFMSSLDKDLAALPAKMNDALETVKPVVEKAKQFASLVPKKMNLKKLIDDAAKEVDNEIKNNLNGLILAGYSEKIPSQQVIMQEETAGVTVLKVYTLVFYKGQWIVQPDWMATSRLVPADSIINMIAPVEIDQQ